MSNAAAERDPASQEFRSGQRRRALEPLRHRDYASCWLTGTVAHTANWMQSIAVPFLVFQMTDSATWLGIAAVAGQAPALLGSPLGGVWADRHSRRGLLLATLGVKACVAFGLFGLWWLEALTLGPMMVLLCANGFVTAVHASGWQSFVAQLVPASAFASAYRLNSIQFNLSRAAGPAVAGWVLAQFGPGTAFLINGLAFLPFAVALVVARPQRVSRPPAQGTLLAFRAGAEAAFRRRALAVPVWTAAILALFGMSLQSLMAGVAAEVFGVGAQGFGWLVSSVGITALLAAIAVVLLGDRVARSTLSQVGLMFYAGGALLVAATKIYAVGLVGFALTGVGHVFVYVSCMTALQLHLDEELRGRVTALYMMGIFIAAPLGAQIGGILGDLAGLPAVVAVYGLAIAGYAIFARVGLDGFAELDGAGHVDPARSGL